MKVNDESIQFYALVTEKLCNRHAFNTNIDVESQHFSIEINERRTTIKVDDQFRLPLVPLHPCSHKTINIQQYRSFAMSNVPALI